MPGRRIEVATLVGSLRHQSYNRALFRTSMLLQNDNLHLYEVPIDQLPFFNEDLERPTDPPTVREFRRALDRADALLVITPEYSYSIPGVLKNALDWASRPSGRSVLKGMPVGIMGASIGRSGTMRAQLHLRQILVQLGAIAIPEPEIYVTFAADKFNNIGELSDQGSVDQVKQLLANLEHWANMLHEMG